MKTKLYVLSVIVIGIAAAFASCNKETATADAKYVYLDLPETPYNYNQPFSSSNDEVVTLGRVLFYDSHLSVNSSISCGTCHKQSIAFSDDVQFSRGFQNKLTSRNTLPIQNLRVSSFFGGGCGGGGGFGDVELFWDGRETNLSDMVLKPILNHVEMGMGAENDIVEKVKTAPYYDSLFIDAFNSTEVTIQKISTALSAFTGSISSSNTIFDRHNSNGGALNGEQEMGRQLFFTKYNCNSCHQTQQLNGYQSGGGFTNIGLDADYADNGLGSLTQSRVDDGKFKIPNLRNVALTAPYMHDGRFATLEEVIGHYSSGIANHPNLDFRLRDINGKPLVLNITSQETSALVAFLKTLTDYSMITDPKFSNPFRSK